MLPKGVRGTREVSSLGSLLPSLVGYNIRLANLAAMKVFEQSFTDLGITPLQFAILECIASKGDLTQTELATEVQTAPAVLVGVLSKLEERAFVVRIKGRDRRTKALQITAEGDAHLREARKRIKLVDTLLTSSLTSKEKDQLIELLRRVAAV